MTRRASIFLALAMAALGACSHTADQQPTRDSGEFRELLFLVRDHHDQIVAHAELVLVSSRGVRHLASTSESGLLSARIPDGTSDDGALLACAEGYYCSGWLLSDPYLRVSLRSPETLIPITLTPLRLH
jgi:hypothetical protein